MNLEHIKLVILDYFYKYMLAVIALCVVSVMFSVWCFYSYNKTSRQTLHDYKIFQSKPDKVQTEAYKELTEAIKCAQAGSADHQHNRLCPAKSISALKPLFKIAEIADVK